MATRTKRKSNTSRALVFNPAGSRPLSIGGAKVNPRRRRKASSRRRRRNPIAATSARRRTNPFRRKSNPITGVAGLVTAAVMAAVGVSIFDLVAMKIAPSSQGLIRTGIKAAGGWAVATYGAKIPVLGKYRNEIALVLLVSAASDVLKLYVFPMVQSTLGVALPSLIAAPAGDGTTQGVVFTPDGRPLYQM